MATATVMIMEMEEHFQRRGERSFRLQRYDLRYDGVCIAEIRRNRIAGA